MGPAWTPRPSRLRGLSASRGVDERRFHGLGRLGQTGLRERGGRARSRLEKAGGRGRRRGAPGERHARPRLEGRRGDEGRGQGRGPRRLPAPTWASWGRELRQLPSCLCVTEPGGFPPFSHARLSFSSSFRVPLRGNCKN